MCMKDRTVSLHGRLYEVDAVLVGENRHLALRPRGASATARPIEVVHDGKCAAGLATRLDAYANTAVKRGVYSKQIEPDDPAPEPPRSPLSLRNLKEDD